MCVCVRHSAVQSASERVDVKQLAPVRVLTCLILFWGLSGCEHMSKCLMFWWAELQFCGCPVGGRCVSYRPSVGGSLPPEPVWARLMYRFSSFSYTQEEKTQNRGWMCKCLSLKVTQCVSRVCWPCCTAG